MWIAVLLEVMLGHFTKALLIIVIMWLLGGDGGSDTYRNTNFPDIGTEYCVPLKTKWNAETPEIRLVTHR